jgi:CPA1 family monovalent cation:H+ antiporter
MIPAMPLAVAFALAAIVSPTDSTAVSAIAIRVPIPKRLMHILDGESLLNDASGLVCMRFAIAAALTGTFSLLDAVGTFLWLAIGGIAIGVGVTWIASAAKNWVSRHFGEETGSQILISLLIPFGAYLLAEHLHCSGILAAVAAGITMSYVEQSGKHFPSPGFVAPRFGTLFSSPPAALSSSCLESSFRSSSSVQGRLCVRPDTTNRSGPLCMWLPSISPLRC